MRKIIKLLALGLLISAISSVIGINSRDTYASCLSEANSKFIPNNVSVKAYNNFEDIDKGGTYPKHANPTWACGGAARGIYYITGLYSNGNGYKSISGNRYELYLNYFAPSTGKIKIGMMGQIHQPSGTVYATNVRICTYQYCSSTQTSIDYVQEYIWCTIFVWLLVRVWRLWQGCNCRRPRGMASGATYGYYTKNGGVDRNGTRKNNSNTRVATDTNAKVCTYSTQTFANADCGSNSGSTGSNGIIKDETINQYIERVKGRYGVDHTDIIDTSNIPASLCSSYGGASASCILANGKKICSSL
ncbi:MAG: hypothetical protein K6F57_00550 [Candidatus Saccharibacteria bacterium]|nr:hypothetical protein [Candidatus Saccharibacteria bacterium]